MASGRAPSHHRSRSPRTSTGATSPFASSLTGAGIVNVAHFCALEALANATRRVDRVSLEVGILRELVKEGKIV